MPSRPDTNEPSQASRHDQLLPAVAWSLCAGLASFPAAVATALIVRSLVASLLPGPLIDDFRLGSLVLTNTSKAGEFPIPFVVLGITIGVAIAVFRITRNDRLSESGRSFLALETILSLPASIPFIFGFGGPLLGIIDSAFALSVLLQFPPAIFFLLTSTQFRVVSPPASLDERTMRLSLWFLAALPLGVLGGITALRYLMVPTTIPAVIWTGLGLGVLTAVALFMVRLGPLIQGNSRRFVILGFGTIGVLALPLLLPPLVGVPGFVPGLNVPAWRAFLLLSALLIIGESGVRYFLGQRDDLLALIPSFGVAALLVPLRGIYALPSIPTDDYHFGERFGPGLLWLDFGQLPYLDIVLPRGLLPNVVPDLLNRLLFEGFAATNPYVNLTVAFVVVGIAHVLFRGVVGFLPATAMVALLAVANSYLESDLLITALLIFSFGLLLRKVNGVLLGVTLAVGGIVALLIYPLMGIAMLLVLATAIIGSSLGSILSRSREVVYAGAVVVSFTTMLAVLLLLPVGRFVKGALDYLLVNAVSNSEAYGVALDLTLRDSFAFTQLLSVTFVLGVFVSVWVLWNNRWRLRHPSWRNYASLMFTASPVVLALGLFGRYMGRLDPAEWLYRPAAGSLVIIGVITPAVLLTNGKAVYSRVAWSLLALASVVSLGIAPIGGGGLLRSSLGLLESPAGWTTASSAEKIPHLGLAQGDPAHLSSLGQIKSVSRRLKRGEPVLNLSNRGALFAYMGWRNPLGYLAPYNIPSEGQEEVVIRQLSKKPPPIAFVGPGPQLDGVSLTLRSPLLARWVMDNYVPLRCGPTTWAFERRKPESAALLDCPRPSGKKFRSAASVWAVGIGAPRALGIIPAAWGSRAAQLPADRIPLRVTRDSESDGLQRFDLGIPLSARVSEGWNEGLLDLLVSCPANPNAALASNRSAFTGSVTARLIWHTRDEAKPLDVSEFEWGAGRLIVPLDAYPTWVENSPPSKPLRLVAPDADCPQGWEIQASRRPR